MTHATGCVAVFFGLLASAGWVGCSTPAPEARDSGADFDASSADAGSIDASTGPLSDGASRPDAGRSDSGVRRDGGSVVRVDAGDDAGDDAGPYNDGGSDSGLVGGCVPLWDPVVSPGADIGGDTYTTYAAGFFSTWCTRCHSSALTTPEERMMAPLSVNLDDETSVRELLSAIRYQVGVGVRMPFNPPLPSCDERFRIVRWIDDGAP